MYHCPFCEHLLSISKLSCEGCQSHFEGKFSFSRLARLKIDYQKLAEALIFSGGNLKDLALKLDLSYPTLKKRLLSLTQNLEVLKEEDELEVQSIIRKIEDEGIKPEEGIKRIKEIQGEL